jgi:hypothetical protein
MKHPIQPLELDDRGTLRFKENKIVRYLLDNGGIDLNKLACLDFNGEDREQFAQLIGYSLSGFGELGYVTDRTYELAQTMYDNDEANQQAEEIERLEAELAALKQSVSESISALRQLLPDE